MDPAGAFAWVVLHWVLNAIAATSHVLPILAAISITYSSSSRRFRSNSSSYSDSAAATVLGNDIPRATQEACEDLLLFTALSFSPEELRIDMHTVQSSYLEHPYHNKHHAADVVTKSAKTLKLDGGHLRRLVRQAQGMACWSSGCERRYMLFQLAVILAAAQHDSLHPGFNNAYLKAIRHPLALAHASAEQASVAYFHGVFLRQQHVLNRLTDDERALVQEIVTYAIAQTDMQVHAAALQWQAEGELEVMKHLAALIVHAADLSNAADAWPVSRLWAQWCNAEFHAQGDHSRRFHPELPVADMFNRSKADVPRSQLGFIETFAAPTLKALSQVAPRTAAEGLQGCKVNAAICRAIMQRNKQCMLQRAMNVLGLGNLPRFL